jgi:hypothetical protein
MTGRRRPRRMWRPCAGLLAIVAGATLLTAACSGGSSNPQVASLGQGHGVGSSAATANPTGNPTQLLDEWAACMRSHGDPGQVDPTVTASKDIDITISPAIPGGWDGGPSGQDPTATGPGRYCRQYVTAAQQALGGGPGSMPHYTTAQLVKYSECMRANGISDFPDPTGGNLVISLGGDLNPASPVYQNAAKRCENRTGVKLLSGTPPPGTVEMDGQTPASAAGG